MMYIIKIEKINNYTIIITITYYLIRILFVMDSSELSIKSSSVINSLTSLSVSLDDIITSDNLKKFAKLIKYININDELINMLISNNKFDFLIYLENVHNISYNLEHVKIAIKINDYDIFSHIMELNEGYYYDESLIPFTIINNIDFLKHMQGFRYNNDNLIKDLYGNLSYLNIFKAINVSNDILIDAIRHYHINKNCLSYLCNKITDVDIKCLNEALKIPDFSSELFVTLYNKCKHIPLSYINNIILSENIDIIKYFIKYSYPDDDIINIISDNIKEYCLQYNPIELKKINDKLSLINKELTCENKLLNGKYNACEMIISKHITDKSELKIENTRLIDCNTKLQNDYIILNSQYISITNDHKVLIDNMTLLQDEHNNIISKHKTLESEYNELYSKYKTLLSDNDALKNNYDTTVNECNTLKVNYDDVQSKYTDIGLLYSRVTDELNVMKSNCTKTTDNYNALLKYL